MSHGKLVSVKSAFAANEHVALEVQVAAQFPFHAVPEALIKMAACVEVTMANARSDNRSSEYAPERQAHGDGILLDLQRPG